MNVAILLPYEFQYIGTQIIICSYLTKTNANFVCIYIWMRLGIIIIGRRALLFIECILCARCFIQMVAFNLRNYMSYMAFSLFWSLGTKTEKQWFMIYLFTSNVHAPSRLLCCDPRKLKWWRVQMSYLRLSNKYPTRWTQSFHVLVACFGLYGYYLNGWCCNPGLVTLPSVLTSRTSLTV